MPLSFSNHRRAYGAIFFVAVCAALLGALPSFAARDRVTLSALDDDARATRAHHDLRLLRSYVRGISRLEQEIKAEAKLFNRDSTRALQPEERRRVFELFERVLAYEVALDSISSFHAEFWTIPPLKSPRAHARHFAVGTAAYLQQLSLGLVFVEKTINKPQFETLLDEGNRRYGIPPGAYGRLKWNVVHVLDVSKVMAARQYHQVLKRTAYRTFKSIKDPDAKRRLAIALNLIDATYPTIKSKLKHKGAKLFAGNGFDILKDTGHSAWFPVQAEVAEWMGDTKVHRKDDALISEDQIASAMARTQPGDILVERRNWYLSNVGLPGFWPHAALWIGSPKELAAFLDDDPDVVAVYGGPFTEALKRAHPQTWATYTSTDANNHSQRVLEAMSEGVVFTTAEHSLHADYAAAMRPRVSKVEIARAIERGFRLHLRPYDFDFDFFSDATIVCSELVYKAYEPQSDVDGVEFMLERIMGRMTLPPNTMVRQFDTQANTDDQQLDFVWFLDGRERLSKAVWNDIDSFRESWQRPKWDIAQK